MKLINRSNNTIDYRSRRHLGLRVWKDRCQIIAPVGSEWAGVGPQLELPLEVPTSIEDFQATQDVSNTVRVTAFRYELEQPGSDLFEVLKKEKTFENALHAAKDFADRYDLRFPPEEM
jgi:hypothetical protein